MLEYDEPAKLSESVSVLSLMLNLALAYNAIKHRYIAFAS